MVNYKRNDFELGQRVHVLNYYAFTNHERNTIKYTGVVRRIGSKYIDVEMNPDWVETFSLRTGHEKDVKKARYMVFPTLKRLNEFVFITISRRETVELLQSSIRTMPIPCLIEIKRVLEKYKNYDEEDDTGDLPWLDELDPDFAKKERKRRR